MSARPNSRAWSLLHQLHALVVAFGDHDVARDVTGCPLAAVNLDRDVVVDGAVAVDKPR